MFQARRTPASAATRRATRELEDHRSMAGKDPDEYRPRRAFDAAGKAGDDAVTAASGSAGGPDDAGSGEAGSGSPEPHESGAGKTGSGTSGWGTSGSGTSGSGRGGSKHSGSSSTGRGNRAGGSTGGSKPDVEPDRSTTILPRVRDDRSTTILPKTAERRRRDELDDDEADVRPLLRGRTRMILTIAGVAAVVIIGLVLGYAALNVGGRPAAEPSAGVSIDPSTGASVTPTPVALLDDSSMINDQMARQIDPDRTWQVASTQRGLDSTSPRAACSPSDRVDGQPAPQQTIQRLLSSSGKNPPALLHQA